MKELNEPINTEPTVKIEEVKASRNVIGPGSHFTLFVSYSASLPGKSEGNLPVELSYSILKGEKVLYTMTPKTFNIQNGSKNTVKFEIGASKVSGTYTIETRAVYQTASDTGRVMFNIR